MYNYTLKLRNGIKFDIDRVVPFKGGEEDFKTGEIGIALPFSVEVDPDKVLIGTDYFTGIVAQNKIEGEALRVENRLTD